MKPGLSGHRAIWLYAGLASLVVAFFFSLSVGSTAVSFSQVFDILLGKVYTGGRAPTWQPYQESIVWQVRLPRVLMAAVAGAGLALVGATIQALVRNPMADPWLLGVSSGASLGAVLIIIYGSEAFASLSLHAMAFLGALCAAVSVFHLARHKGSMCSVRLILIGIAISFAFNAVTQLLIFSASHASQVRGIMFWTLGSLGGVELRDLTIPALTLFGCFIYIFRVRDKLNIITLTDTKAFSMGLDLKKFRRNLFIVCALLTSVLVSVTGAIGFVGLIIPHLLRITIGGNYRSLIPACFLYGAVFLVVADALARTVFAPEELPIGVFTALLGSPIFIWLMRRSYA